jgi:hypothetical protein
LESKEKYSIGKKDNGRFYLINFHPAGEPEAFICCVADAGDPLIDKHPKSEIAEACNLIIEKIMGDNMANLLEDRSTYYDL